MSTPESPKEGSPWWLTAVKNLSLTNVLILALLVIILVPAYSIYRALNDPEMLGRFLSSYEEQDISGVSCILRIASIQGGGDTYAIASGFAFQGAERWQISVILDHKPTPEEMHSHCATLQLITDRMLALDEPM